MSHIALDDPPEHLSDITVPKGGCPFPPFGVSAVLLDPPPPAADEGWSFVDSFELAMLAACLAGASLLAATLFGADPLSDLFVVHVAARQAQAVLSVLAGVSFLVALVFAGEGLFRLRSLARTTGRTEKKRSASPV